MMRSSVAQPAFILALGLALASARPLPAQSAAHTDPSFAFQTEVSTILVPVTVRDRKGRLVSHLTEDKFRLFVDGIQFPYQAFWREAGLPLSMAFVLDTSGSMGGRRLTRAREVIQEFLRQRGPEDEFSLVTFGAGEVTRRLEFGTDPSLLPRILESLRGFGTTAVYDMVSETPSLMEGAKAHRRVAILFTDGVDTASTMTPGEVSKILEGISDPLYVFGIEPPPPGESAEHSYEEVLQMFAKESGGRYIRVDDVRKMPEIGRELRRELTMRYILNFQASGIGIAKWRTIDVKVDGSYAVQARKGYRGTLP